MRLDGTVLAAPTATHHTSVANVLRSGISSPLGVSTTGSGIFCAKVVYLTEHISLPDGIRNACIGCTMHIGDGPLLRCVH